MSDTKVGGCGYQGHEFGAPYPDSICGDDGYLWDADSGDSPDALAHGGEIPCPECNREKWLEYHLDRMQPGDLDEILTDRTTLTKRVAELEAENKRLTDALKSSCSDNRSDYLAQASTVSPCPIADQLQARLKAEEAALKLLYSWVKNWDCAFLDDDEWIGQDRAIIEQALK